MIVTASAQPAKPRHGTLAAVEDGDEAIVISMTRPAESFLDRARVTHKDDAVAVQPGECGDLIVTRAADVCRKQQTAATVHVRQEAIRAPARGVLKRIRRHGKVARCRRATDPDAALLVRQQRVG